MLKLRGKLSHAMTQNKVESSYDFRSNPPRLKKNKLPISNKSQRINFKYKTRYKLGEECQFCRLLEEKWCHSS
jgi:hypothetical protein